MSKKSEIVEAPTEPQAPSGALGPGAGSALCTLYTDRERNALMTALQNAAKVDAVGAPYPADDMIYCYLENTPKTSLVSELVDELHRLGYRIQQNTPVRDAAKPRSL